MTWAEVLVDFGRHLSLWTRKGFPTVGKKEHMERYSICQNCDNFDHYQCRLCSCVCYIKTKLATESCPAIPPKWEATIR